MKTKNSFYLIVKKIHLYASLSIVTLLIMYLITSYMMIYHDFFKVERQNDVITYAVSDKEILDKNWEVFLVEHKIKGRLVDEKTDPAGNLIRKYEKVGSNQEVTILKTRDSVRIKTTKLNLSGKVIGFHRARGYGGGIQYNIYAFLLDLTGISLILFAITGIIMWLKILKQNKIAWTILVLGFVYVSTIVFYLTLI